MPGVVRNTVDLAGGVIGNAPLQVFCRAEGFLIAIKGELIQSHSAGDPPHNNATMRDASLFVRINNTGICRAGDFATCLHQAAPGSLIVLAD